jgi:uncharacterized membrane protein YphA (DoxX/SURF4 family)
VARVTPAAADDVRPTEADPVLADPGLVARGLAVLRIFFGVILFANGVAKLFAFTDLSVGPYEASLIDRGLAHSILENEGARTELPFIETIANDLLLANWGFFQWAITALELGVGALLIVGLATRGAALLGLGQQLFLAGLYFSSRRWAFEQPHEYVPLIVLAIVPAGRVWGLDRRLLRARPELRRWPF